jgi:hypothetical protein
MRRSASPWPVAGAVVVCWMPLAGLAFSLISPVNEAALVAGQAVNVAVDPGGEVGLSEVRYYWYRVNEEPLVEQMAHPGLTATGSMKPPYGGQLIVPLDSTGRMRLLAVGEVTRGRLAGEEEFDEVIVSVGSPAPLQGIEFEVQKPWRLDTLGKVLEIPVIGQFADGVIRRIRGKSSGNTYSSSDPAVVTVTADGFVRVAGNGRAVISVMNDGKQGTLEVLVRAGQDDPNQPPMAHAGPDLTVKGGSRVVLNGLGSSDPDGDPIRYEWTQVLGNKVSLLDPNTPKPTFMAPRVSSRRLFRFMLRVTDMRGPDTVRGADSFPVYTNVWVVP